MALQHPSGLSLLTLASPRCCKLVLSQEFIRLLDIMWVSLPCQVKGGFLLLLGEYSVELYYCTC